MMTADYFSPKGGLPPQQHLHTGRAVFTPAYAVLPAGTMRDITVSHFPGWQGMRAWVLARPMTGFAETFAQYLVELTSGGVSPQTAEPDRAAQAVLFVVSGQLSLNLNGAAHELAPGGYAYIPPGMAWSVRNTGTQPVSFHWIRKAYQPADGVDKPEAFVTHEADIEAIAMPDTDGRWTTKRFVDMADMRHDMHVNIVAFEPGGTIPFEETHVMEHGIYILEGKAVYLLNKDWVEVEAGDFIWLRAFCPQACYAGGPGRFRYLLYKDANRHPRLTL